MLTQLDTVKSLVGSQPRLGLEQADPGFRLPQREFPGGRQPENAAARHRDVTCGWRAVGPAHAGIIAPGSGRDSLVSLVGDYGDQLVQFRQ